MSWESWLQGHGLSHGRTNITFLDTRLTVPRVFRDIQIVTCSF